MIAYTYRRTAGGDRYSSTQRAEARRLSVLDAPPTLTDGAVDAMTDPDGIRVVVDVLFELTSNRLRRPTTVRFIQDGPAATTVDATDDETAAMVDGWVCPTVDRPGFVFTPEILDTDAGVELTWDDPRTVNTVAVHGDGLTSVDVSTRNADDSWTPQGSRAANNHATIRLAGGDVECYGVRVLLGPDSDPVTVTEVDPMWILDVSDDVENLEVAWSREADPGSSTTPAGTFEASELTLTLDNTSGFWNPAGNSSLDIGHRIEVAVGVIRPPTGEEPPGPDVEELFPAGVFYSEPFDTDSESVTVTVQAVDRLGRDSDTVVTEFLTVGETVGEIVSRLALKYLDLDADQVVVDDGVAAVVIPLAYPSGNLGSYLADLAKATAATMHMDPLDRLVFSGRGDTSGDVVAELTSADALIRHRRPPGFDVTTSIVTVNAAPLTVAADEVDLWAMPSGGITVPNGESYTLIARYDTAPAFAVNVTGVVADGDYTLVSQVLYADRAEVVISNDEPSADLVVADLRVRGFPLIEASLTARREHAPSVARYGPRELTVDARLIQTQAQVEAVATVLLDAFRSLDDTGTRRLPEVSFDGLGILHATTGDRVTLSDPDKGLGGDYLIVARRLVYEGGALLLNDVRCREASGAGFLTLDVDRIDDTAGLGY